MINLELQDSTTTDHGIAFFKNELLAQVLRPSSTDDDESLKQNRLKLINTVTMGGFLRKSSFGNMGLTDLDCQLDAVNELLDALTHHTSYSFSGEAAPQTEDRRLDHWLRALATQMTCCIGRVFAVLSKNRLGLCPEGAQKGDIIVAVLHGASVPVVLRAKNEHDYAVVGPCFVDWEVDQAERFRNV